MAEPVCRHQDVRKFDGIRCCLSCGEAVFGLPKIIPIRKDEIVGTRVPYTYTKLNYRLGREIRLVVLEPGRPADPIRCDAIHVNLEDDPDYEAVSYTWSTESGNCKLSHIVHCVNGQYFTVTENCYTALHQLRRPVGTRLLWIDAICIQQEKSSGESVNERNHQVSFMDQIYSQARNVRVCLQDPQEYTEPLDYTELFCWLQRGGIREEKQIFVTPIRRLLSLRYFKRAWVIQEVAKARSAWLHVNDHEVLLTTTVMNNLVELALRHQMELPGVLRWVSVWDAQVDILTCLQAAFDCYATDERDKIFAVLSLMEPHIRSLIPVDYSLTLPSVLMSTSIAVIVDQKNLDLLRYAKALHTWNGAASVKRLTMERFRQFIIDNINRKRTDVTRIWKRCPQMELIDESEGLKSAQIWRDTVNVEVAVTMPSETSCLTSKKTCVLSPMQKGFLPRIRVRAHFIDTISPEKDSQYKIWNNVTVQSEDPRLRTTRRVTFEKLFQIYARTCSRFLTKYSAGFAPGHFEVGDMVFAIDSLRIPLILRKDHAQVYHIISECYLLAALELDCWNPGTKKGRWGPDVPRPEGPQTRMIEIY